MTLLISEDYKKIQAQLHHDKKHYGTTSKKWVQHILMLADELKTRDILDYGCGKGFLQQNIPYSIQEYDPAIYDKSVMPKPADLVVCTDVLEHVEPDCLDNVIMHLKSVVKKLVFIAIHGNPANKTLPDGRNCHLIVENGVWWFSKLSECFTINSYMRNFDNKNNQEFIFLAQQNTMENHNG